MGWKRKNFGQANSSLTPEDSSNGDQSSKSQPLKGILKGDNGIVTHASVKTEKNPVPSPMREIIEPKNHMEAAQLKWKSFTA